MKWRTMGDRRRYGAVWVREHPAPHIALVHRVSEDLEELPEIGTYYRESAVKELVEALKGVRQFFLPPPSREAVEIGNRADDLLDHYKNLK